MNLPLSLIILGAGNSQLPIIKKAKNMNYTVFAIDKNPQAPGFEYADFTINVSTLNTKKILFELKKFQNNYDFKGIVSRTTGEPLLTAATISREFHLPGLIDDLVHTAISKSKFRNFCFSHNILFPKGKKINSTKKLNLEDIEFPVILKPDLTNLGKTNIFLCETPDDFLNYFQTVSNTSFNTFVELESFVDGIDVTCACLTNSGNIDFIAWWDELVGITTDNEIVSIGVSIPSVINLTKTKKHAESIVQKILSFFPTLNALILISFRISMTGTPFVIELHLDLGGDLIADELLPIANPEFDYFETVIKIATNTLTNVTPIEFQPTVMYYLSKNSNSNQSTSVRYSDHSIIQNNSIQKNLIELKSFLTTRKLNLKFFPKHKEWLDKNHS